jgi:hypothetical protein
METSLHGVHATSSCSDAHATCGLAAFLLLLACASSNRSQGAVCTHRQDRTPGLWSPVHMEDILHSSERAGCLHG